MLTRCFDWIGHFAVSRPRLVLAGYVVILLAIVPLLGRLHLDVDVRGSLPPDMAQALERQQALFGTADLAFVLVQGPPGSRAALLAFAAAWQERLASEPLIQSMQYGYPPTLLTMLDRLSLEYAPLFVPPAQLEEWQALLTPEGIQSQIYKTMLQLSTLSTGLQEQWLLTDPLQLRRFALARLAALRGTFRFDPTSPYFLTPDGTALLVKMTGTRSVHDMAGAKATVALIQDTSAALRGQAAFQHLSVEATGGYFFAAESERVIRGDITMSVHLTMVSIATLLAWSLRRWGILLYGLLPTIVALIIALGMFAVFRSTLNALTLGCLASLIGFGMDYTLHVLQRAFTEQAQGLERTAALRLAIRDTGGALLLATTTTMACYLAFLVAHQPFLHDLGLLAALGMGLSCVLSVTFLPALLVLLPQPGPPRLPRTLGLPRLSATVARYPRSILALSLLLSLVAAGALWLWPPRFETDLRNIHAANSPTLQVQARIATLFGGSHEPLMLLVEQSTEAQVLQDLQRLQPTLQAMIQDGLLAAVTSPAMLYPEHAAQHAAVQPLHTRDIPQLLAVLRSTLANAGFDERAIHDYSMRVQHALSHRESIDLATFRRLGFDTLLQPLLAHDARGAVGVAMLFPTNDLWTHATRDAMSQRLTTTLATEGIQGTLSGLYTISAASATLLSGDFLRITVAAFLGVIGLVILHVRRPWSISMVLLPIGCGILWTAGVCALGGFTLNFMNICILPMLLGTGSDYGVYIVHRFTSSQRADMPDTLRIAGLGVLLSALTTLEGFGTLALSVNRGLASVGLLSCVGITACILAALTTLPAVLQLWSQPPPREEAGSCVCG